MHFLKSGYSHGHNFTLCEKSFLSLIINEVSEKQP